MGWKKNIKTLPAKAQQHRFTALKQLFYSKPLTRDGMNDRFRKIKKYFKGEL